MCHYAYVGSYNKAFYAFIPNNIPGQVISIARMLRP